LLFLSRIHPVKNLPSLICAIPALAEEFPGVHLVVAGGGDLSYVQRMRAIAESSAGAKRIVFVGPISGEAKSALVCSATVMAIPSFHENFGMAVAEGLACSVPALVTPGLGMGAEILACGAGFSCGEDASSIAACLRTALRDPSRISIAGENGRRWALRTLSALAVSGQLIRLYAAANVSQPALLGEPPFPPQPG
jgi:glycosyltransferase involved in cell wall biosynthesis